MSKLFSLHKHKCTHCKQPLIKALGEGTLEIACKFCRAAHYIHNGQLFVGAPPLDLIEDAPEVECPKCEHIMFRMAGYMEYLYKCKYCRATQEVLVPADIPQERYAIYLENLRKKSRQVKKLVVNTKVMYNKGVS